MAPGRSIRGGATNNAITKRISATTVARKGLVKRTTQSVCENADIIQQRGKRKAEHSPAKNEKVKRSALGNLTNNHVNHANTNVNYNKNSIKMTVPSEEDIKQQKPQATKNRELINLLGPQANVYQKDDRQSAENTANKAIAPCKIMTRASSRSLAINSNVSLKVTNVGDDKISAPDLVADVPIKNKIHEEPPPAPMIQNHQPPVIKLTSKPVRRISNEFHKIDESSLYMSALDMSCESVRLSGNFEKLRRRSSAMYKSNQKINNIGDIDIIQKETELGLLEQKVPPPGVEDFDKINWNDPFMVSHYANEIFAYLKQREILFPIDDYMKRQGQLSTWMRTLLVDWMVEVQETFELNHETLYLAVKIVDLFLSKITVNKDTLQLLGAAAMLIACKYDERTPPFIEDFLYICDGAYTNEQLIKMEMEVLRGIGYDLGIPLSYRFLRRYARSGKVSMPTLTLARFILELSLMDYDVVGISDSKLASAALFMALRLHGTTFAWNETLEYYSGYNLIDFVEIVPLLNAGLHRKYSSSVKTIRNKYSHKVFHEVAKVTLMSTEDFLKDNFNLTVYHIDISKRIQISEKNTKNEDNDQLTSTSSPSLLKTALIASSQSSA